MIASIMRNDVQILYFQKRGKKIFFFFFLKDDYKYNICYSILTSTQIPHIRVSGHIGARIR